MIYQEIKDDLFKHLCTEYDEPTSSKRVGVHCISADFAMSGGIAVPMAKKFSLRNALSCFYNVKSPTCIFVNNVMNLITKDNVWDSPTYKSLTASLVKCREICEEEGIKYLAMPKIGCGIDRLEWFTVKTLIKEVFKDTDIDILVCIL